MKTRRGFTLLELLMVVIIIGILASIALPQYIKATERARAAQAISWLGTIRSAELRFAATSTANAYTNNVALLDIDIVQPPEWNAAGAVFSLTAGAGGVNPKGFVTLARDEGQFSALTLGIQFGTGTLCGTFTVQNPSLAACVQD